MLMTLATYSSISRTAEAMDFLVGKIWKADSASAFASGFQQHLSLVSNQSHHLASLQLNTEEAGVLPPSLLSFFLLFCPLSPVLLSQPCLRFP